jgi:hypothetical protein
MLMGFCAKHQDFYKGINYKKSSRNPQRIFQVKKKRSDGFLSIAHKVRWLGVRFNDAKPNLCAVLFGAMDFFSSPELRSNHEHQ